MRKVNTKNLTPKMAWDKFVNTSEEMFISNFMADNPPVTDIKTMCEIYALELPIIFEHERMLFTIDQMEQIKKLITEHLENYIEEKGGIDKLELLSVEELDHMEMIEWEKLMNLIAKRYNITREEVSKILTKE